MQIKCQTLFVAVAFLLSLTTASAQVPYGLAPDTVTAADISAQGSGENGYAAALIALVPNDPVFARLKGQTIVGVRCNLRADYKQKSQKRSYAMACEGTPTNQVRRTNVNFSAGWNDVLFDEPLTIGDDTIFVGYQVYETIGTSLPITGYSGASVDGGCWLNIKNGGWTSYSDRGTLLISALLADGSEELIGNAAYVQCVEHPLTVAPSAYFGGTVYVHNLSSQPLASLALAMQGEGDAASTIGQLTFDEAIPAYGARLVSTSLFAPAKEGTAVEWGVWATEFNGTTAAEARHGETTLYVTQDAFQRATLVEDFTGQTCSNCPRMMYYLEQALEADPDAIYVAHHAGFSKDSFTCPADEALLFLFDGGTYNPAVMFNRSILTGQTKVIQGMNSASDVEYYANFINLGNNQAAMAKLTIEPTLADGTASCKVSGQVASDLKDAALRLTVYLVEDSIPTTKYIQYGLDVEGIPEGYAETFRHNGVVRHCFTATLGDELTPADDATFAATFDGVAMGSEWVAANCRIVALVHYANESDIAANSVLNAAHIPLTADATGISQVIGDRSQVTSETYDLQGRRVRNAAAAKGLLIENGRKVIRF